MEIQALRNSVHRLPVLSRSPLARQFVKFSLVGVTNTLWDFLLYIVLTRGLLGFQLHFLVANFVAFFASVVNSYILNKRWTVRNTDRRHHVQFGKFFLVNLVSLGVYETLLFFLIEHAEVYDLLAKGVSVVFVMVWNFAANKYWTFREPRMS